MTNDEYFAMLSRRKSVRKFQGPLTEAELDTVRERCGSLVPLVEGLPIRTFIVPRQETPARFGEHALLFYSAAHPMDKVNAGYMLQQLDLWLESAGFGSCWYGMARPEEQRKDGLDFVIMLCFGRGLDGGLRNGPEEFRRKTGEEIWPGGGETAETVRLAPSACNSQPWRFVREAGVLRVFRETELRTIIPRSRRPLFNGIDLGISLFYLETALKHQGRAFTRRLLPDGKMQGSLVPIAEYFF